MNKPYTVYVVFTTEFEVKHHKCFEKEFDVVKYASEISSNNNSDCKITRIFALTEVGEIDELELIFKGRLLLVEQRTEKETDEDPDEEPFNPFMPKSSKKDTATENTLPINPFKQR